MRPERVLLAQMPMGLVQVPNLGLSLLKPSVARAGIPCDVRYLNVEFVQRFLGGHDAVNAYVRLVESQSLAEICAAHFSAARFGRTVRRDDIIASEMRHATSEQRDLIDAIVYAIDPFLDYCVEAVPWSRYALVGFTSLFAGMTLPSVVLAGRLKEAFPHLRIVLGGWNTGGAMGEALAEHFRELDFVLRGEADETMPRLAAAVLTGGVPEHLPGLVFHRGNGRAVEAIPQALVPRLDTIPFPDFDDYYTTVGGSATSTTHARSLPFESSRGCWWGQISHCKFCGLNGLSMPYRSKSPARLVAELDHIVGRHQPTLLFAADTILDNGYFAEVLPTLRGRYGDVTFAYEIKAPVTRPQMQALAEAHVVQITVGIESLSTRLLRVMGKGTTGLQNIHCLRVAAEVQVQVGWQYLFGFPTETFADYEPIPELMSRLHHLTPPEQACLVTVARFSPYFEQAATHHVGNLRPTPEYVASYPWPVDDVARVAYHFEFDHQDGRESRLTARIGAVMRVAVAEWRAHHAAATLDAYHGAKVLVIVDARTDRRVVYLLRGDARDVYDALDSPTAEPQLVAAWTERAGTVDDDWLTRLLALHDEADLTLIAWAVAHAHDIGAAVATLTGDERLPSDVATVQTRIRATLDRLDEAGLIVSEGNKHLALAVRRSMPVPAATSLANEYEGDASREPVALPR